MKFIKNYFFLPQKVLPCFQDETCHRFSLLLAKIEIKLEYSEFYVCFLLYNVPQRWESLLVLSMFQISDKNHFKNCKCAMKNNLIFTLMGDSGLIKFPDFSA